MSPDHKRLQKQVNKILDEIIKIGAINLNQDPLTALQKENITKAITQQTQNALTTLEGNSQPFRLEE